MAISDFAAEVILSFIVAIRGGARPSTRTTDQVRANVVIVVWEVDRPRREQSVCLSRPPVATFGSLDRLSALGF